MNKHRTWKDPIDQAAEDIARQYAPCLLKAEVIHKEWPADGIVYVRLYDAEGGEEWVLLDRDCDYDKAYAMMLPQAERLVSGGGRLGVR